MNYGLFFLKTPSKTPFKQTNCRKEYQILPGAENHTRGDVSSFFLYIYHSCVFIWIWSNILADKVIDLPFLPSYMQHCNISQQTRCYSFVVIFAALTTHTHTESSPSQLYIGHEKMNLQMNLHEYHCCYYCCLLLVFIGWTAEVATVLRESLIYIFHLQQRCRHHLQE